MSILRRRWGMTTAELIEALERGERDRRPVEADGLRFTHLDRILWPGEGLTKGDMVRYYARVAEVMVPYLADRPLMLKRYNRGIGGRAAVQQRAQRRVPDDVRTGEAPTAEGGRALRYIGSRATLLYAAQLNAVEIHPWQSRLASPDRPDWVVFDLDPSPGAGFRKVVRIARLIHEYLAAVGVPSAPKTSGSRGIHVYVPTGGTVEYDVAAAFARRVAERIAAEAPSLATVARPVGERGYRVYVDHLQNARGKTAVAPYSIRARRGAPVSMPIRWDEVNERLGPRDFTLAGVPGRLERAGDAWAEVFRRPAVKREHFLG